MARVLLQRARGGFRTVRGEVVRRTQRVLEQAGDSPGAIDGVFGSDTEDALIAFQKRKGLAATGKLTDESWTQLFHEPPPDILQRCLQLTADFEGHGFLKAVGNFDGAGLTWGVIGFTLKHGEMQAILAEIRLHHPVLLTQAFGALENEMMRVLRASRQEQIDWADGISLGSSKYRVEPLWEAAFAKLGSFPEVQAIQLERVQKYWKIAVRDAARFALASEMGIGLCFDVAVQNGGVDFDGEERRIKRWIDDNPGTSERELRMRIADVVADNSAARYVEDVRARKRAFASGDGDVHGARYATADWGLADHPWR
jgi:hypothetical protein